MNYSSRQTKHLSGVLFPHNKKINFAKQTFN